MCEVHFANTIRADIKAELILDAIDEEAWRLDEMQDGKRWS